MKRMARLALVPLLLLGIGVRAEIPQKAPFKVLYDNDRTNILSCPIPNKTPFQPFREEELHAAVVENRNQRPYSL